VFGSIKAKGPKQDSINESGMFLSASLYQGNPDRKHKLWNIGSNERYILLMQVRLKCCYI
jgi:hypothetical protein